MPLKCLRLFLGIKLILALLVAVHVRLRGLKLLLRCLLVLIALVWRLIIQSTFRLNSTNWSLVAYCSLALLFISGDGRIRPRLIHATIRYDALHLHHGVKLLTSLLELLFVRRMVWIWAYGAHGVGARLLSDNISEAAHHSCLILNLDMNRMVRVNWASIWHWPLGSCSLTSTGLSGDAAHLSCGLENLLTTSTTSVHGVVHHSCLVKLAIGLTVERIVLTILYINTLRSTRTLKVLTLSSISIVVARPLISDNTASNHTQSTTILALSCNLLEILIVHLAICSCGKGDHTTSALHRAHSQLGKIVGVAIHGGIHIVCWTGALI